MQKYVSSQSLLHQVNDFHVNSTGDDFPFSKSQSLLHQVNDFHVPNPAPHMPFSYHVSIPSTSGQWFPPGKRPYLLVRRWASQSLLHQVNDFHLKLMTVGSPIRFRLNPFYIRSMISTQIHMKRQNVLMISLNPFYIRSMISTPAYVTLELTTTCKAISCNLHNL